MTAGPDCVPIERLAAAELATADHAHVAACARCQTERALAQAFEAEEPRAEEGAAVEWIVRETRRRVFPEPATVAAGASTGPRRWALPQWATWASAALAASLGVYLLVRTPGMPSVPIESEPAYRSTTVALVAPVGDVPTAPTELRWQSVANAARYVVSVSEVDGTELWRSTTDGLRADLPDAVRTAARPARTLHWRVEAVDAAGRSIGEPGTASFSVRP